jgi:hypothetical protein
MQRPTPSDRAFEAIVLRDLAWLLQDWMDCWKAATLRDDCEPAPDLAEAMKVGGPDVADEITASP